MKPECAAVAEADGVPAAWLADNAVIWRIPGGDGSGAGRTETLLPDCSDDRDRRAELRRGRRGRGNEGAERSLGVDRAAAPQLAVLDADRDVTGDRVDMPEEHDLALTSADDANRVASVVDLGAKAARIHLTAELCHGRLLVVGQTRNLDQTPQQFDVAIVRRHSLSHARWRDFRC